MRVLGRVLAIVLLVLAAIAAGAYFFRAPLAGAAIRWALAGAGVENPSLNVSSVSLSHLAVAKVTAGESGRGISIAKLEAGYSWRGLVFGRRVKTIAVGPGEIVIDVEADGTMSVAGARLNRSGGGGAKGLPFDALTINDLGFLVDAPEGDARGRASGSFTPEDGGEISLSAKTQSLSTDALTLANGSIDASIGLAPDGALNISARAAGDITTPRIAVRNARIAFNGTGASWRNALTGDYKKLTASGALDLQSADILTDGTPTLSVLAEEERFELGAIRVIAVAGKAAISLADGYLKVEAVEGAPIRADADRGDVLTVEMFDDSAPLYEEAPDRRQMNLKAALSGDAIKGDAYLRAESSGNGRWRYDASAELDEQSIAGIALGGTKFAATGTAAPQRLDSEVSISTLVRNATIGRLTISDAALNALLKIDADRTAKSLSVVSLGDDCIALKKARFAIVEQDSDARLSDATFCNAVGPLVEAHWGEDKGAEVAGTLYAREAQYRIGATRFDGAPPMIDFTSSYDPKLRITTAEGAFSGGSVTLNNAIIASKSSGKFSARLDQGLSGQAALSNAVLSQKADPVQVAPVIASGAAALADDKFTFEYTARAPTGARLGQGEGFHDIKSGRGETEFRSGRLEFAPSGLQPSALVPAVLGIIGETTGAGQVDAAFGWGPRAGDRRSSANFKIEDVTFTGPGVAVTQTVGLVGALRLSNLAPLTSDGPQTLTVRRVDLDALQLENGIMHFSVPGDETIRVIDAEFPWFGGVIGAYDAVASLKGGEASIPLRTDKADLAKIFEYVDVDGLSGEGLLSGVLPISISGGRARIENGILKSDGPGAVRYRGAASDTASAAGDQAEIAFSILRDLRYNELQIEINGPLDGRLDFQMRFEGTGEVPLNKQNVRVPVIYRINLDAALLELLNQANLSRNIELQIQRGLQEQQEQDQ